MKWRLPRKPTLPIEIKEKTFSSETQENHEQFRNKPDNCKALASPNLVQVSALWLATHRHECDGALIPFIRERFPLTALEAIEAVKLGKALVRGDRHE
ncbi:hypothetical protein [Brucella sp. 2280]|uniref:hypothetical protein n=1 Tax=Brucella sp. 2280 TaxID=2592625 RepID=UPI001295FA33|nr:hypothetical protein [Brucella sp. 2280]QGA56254.1 hypothetical protein GHC20_03780 [Brucella sp. 2280]